MIGLAVLLIVTLACGASGGGEGAESESSGNAPSSGGSGSVKTDFPLPRKYDNLMETGPREAGINFQTPMSIDEVMAFYREEFGDKLGYTERDYLTSQTESTFQLVFDGHPRGLPIVIQGVDLGNGTTNVNVGFEDV
jgi:hypothetical protein